MIKRLLLLALAAAPTPAWASCAAASQYSFAFANQAAATLSYGSTYTYTAATSGGASLSFTTAIAQNGMSSTQVNATQMPAISTLITGSDATKRDLVLGGVFGVRTTSLSSGTNAVTVTFTFTVPIRDFAVTLHDVDFTTNQYRDWVMVSGTNGAATYTPVLSSSWGNGNGAAVPRTATNSSVTFGPNTTPMTLSANQAAGSGASGNNSDTGNVNASFAQPVTSVTVRYGNAPLSSGETTTGQQAAGIAGISFCPMPAISIMKTSAPIVDALGAFNMPGSDVAYTLSVTNSGASPVDAGAIVLTDLLPAGVTFKNAAGANGTPFTLVPNASGVTLGTGSANYSADRGATWSYTPAAGYDAGVTGVRVVPTGEMAANSSFAVSFVARIK